LFPLCEKMFDQFCKLDFVVDQNQFKYTLYFWQVTFIGDRTI